MHRPLIVDGGLATGLEAMGHRLHPRLWSAGVFCDAPEAVEELHRAYLAAGADVLISASYQMSFDGLAGVGLDATAAADAMRRTVDVARRARDRWKPSAIVAASVGPYGATLADGSEYSGRHGLDASRLEEFHGERFRVLSEAGADLLAIETIPSMEEAEALGALAARLENIQAWISFSCRDTSCLRDGTPISRAAGIVAGIPQIKAVGVNCTAPEHVAGLMGEIRSATTKPIVVYPNSGETWDAEGRRWRGSFSSANFARLATSWADKGAWAIGGCCRVGPDVIAKVAAAIASR